MAYRMRVRRRVRSSSRVGRYFKRRNFTRLQRIARSGRQAVWKQSGDVLDGASGNVKACGFYLPLFNTTPSGVHATSATLLKYRAEITGTAYLQSGTSHAGDRKIAFGMWKYRHNAVALGENERTTAMMSVLITTAYFPGRYMIGKSRRNFGFQWLRRKEITWPVVPKVLSNSRPDPIAHIVWPMYNVRLKPYEGIGLAAWVVDDSKNANMRYTVHADVRVLAQTDQNTDSSEPSDILRFNPDVVGRTYDQSVEGTWYDIGVETGAG